MGKFRPGKYREAYFLEIDCETNANHVLSVYICTLRECNTMTVTYSSPKIAKEMSRQFGSSAQTVKVEMKYTKEVGHFIHRVESAQRDTVGSKLVFK